MGKQRDERKPSRVREVWNDGGRFALIVIWLVAVLLTASFVFGTADADEGGNVAEWVAALSTLAALLAALVAAHYAGRTFTIERGRDADRDRERRQVQVARFAAWIQDPIAWIGGLVTTTIESGQPVSVRQQSQPVLPERITVIVRNASALPIHGLRLEFYVRAKGSSDPWAYAGHYVVGLVPPDTTEEVVADDVGLWEEMSRVLDGISGSRDEPVDLAGGVNLGWSLTDNAGVRWRKSPGSAGPVEESAEPL